MKFVDDATRDADPEVADVAREQMAQLDAGETTYAGDANAVRDKRKPKPECQTRPAQRREVVAELAGSGMSNRAIADVIGVSHPTVINDRRSGGQNLPPDKVAGQDGDFVRCCKCNTFFLVVDFRWIVCIHLIVLYGHLVRSYICKS